jgi:HEAT repeat protein
MAVFSLPAQEILDSYERNFVRVDLSAKVEILRDAATDENAREFIGRLYEFALNFSLQNAGFFREDPDMVTLTALAARGVGEVGHKASVDTLWKVFSSYHDSLTRTTVLESLSILGKENPQVAEHLNQFLISQNQISRSGTIGDFSIIRACINALGALGFPPSYPALFSALNAGYPEPVVKEIGEALNALNGDYRAFLIEVIRKNPLPEKLAALAAGAGNDQFNAPQKGEIAEAALETGLAFSTTNAGDDAMAANLRYEAALLLARLQWTRGSPLAIRHFYRVQTDYQRGAAPKPRLLEAIACLGAMVSSEAAEVLALQLGYINSHTERNGEFDADITLAVVNAIGLIGDKSAFDYLLYVGYLSYPENIQAAARDALARLKW